MRLLFTAAFLVSAFAAAPAAAQMPSRSHVECAIRVFPDANRAEFRRRYAEDAASSAAALVQPEVMQAMLGCMDAAMLQGSQSEAEQRGDWLGRAWGSYELMNAAQASIGSIDPGHARNLDAAYGRLTAAQRATLIITGDGVSSSAGATSYQFALLVSPALTAPALDANPQLRQHLRIYVAARATYESMVERM